ncbi:hypothetical protein F5B21DRAFT_397466 [Xylaria acuta]|nr:hypothetical protein F5B21DRAFT_397466 [Xylaria acuta]
MLRRFPNVAQRRETPLTATTPVSPSGNAISTGRTSGFQRGQIGEIGRIKYWEPGPRMTFFTPISDIFDDIQEKCGMLARPQLPQYRDEADRWPVYPVCKQCFNLREYLESRRSSRELMLSMIGFQNARGERDNDLTSVSEPATLKDQPYLIRHTGLEEAASSFGGGSAVSPAPVHALYPLSQAVSPGVSELRSPNLQTLNDDDL